MFAHMQFLKGFRQNKCNVESNLYVIFTCFYRMHLCDHCGLVFTKKWNFTRHVATVHETKMSY